MKGWVKEASLKHELKITDNGNCPFHNPKHKTKAERVINACEKHKWVCRKWYESEFGTQPWVQR